MFDLLVNIINWLIDVFASAIEGIVSLLPKTPFEFKEVVWGDFGNFILYFIPVSTIATHFTLILGAIALWYAYRWIFRLLQVIR